MALRPAARVAAIFAVPVLVTVSLPLFIGPAAAGDGGYDGSAVGLEAEMAVDEEVVLDETLPGEGVVYPAGGKKELVKLPDSAEDLATLTILTASSALEGDTLHSESRTADFSLLGDIVTADAVNADCTADGTRVQGDSDVAGLTLAGIKVPVDPLPNFTVEVPESLSNFLTGTLILNETKELEGDARRIRALHVDLLVDPAGLEVALRRDQTPTKVREIAEDLRVSIERITGSSLRALADQISADAAGRLSSGSGGAPVPNTAALEFDRVASLSPAHVQRPAAPQEDDLALIDINVIVSEVMCDARTAAVNDAVGRPGDAADPADDAAGRAGDAADPADDAAGTAAVEGEAAADLPQTGGNGFGAAATATAGLALLFSGSTAVFLTRRRVGRARV